MTPELLTCPSCGGESPSRYRVCGHCGTVLSEAPAAEIRRQATIVTSDLKGSTALGERLDPESLREVMTTYINEMQAVFEAHGGTIEKIIGDAIVAVFGLPTARDDDALRAVEAAAESQRALASLNDRLEQRWGVRLTVRTGVASGDVVVGEAAAAQHVLTGPTIAIATAMEQNSPPQEVLMADSTYQLVRDRAEVEPLPDVTPKGTSLSIPSYRLVSVAERDEGGAEQVVAEGVRICATCGEENPEAFRFCGSCGATLAARVVVRDTRKTVTVVFADPKPSTADGSAPTPEALRDVMSGYFAAMQQALASHGATVEKFIGDAVMAVFGLPIRHEDDALRAVRAARDMQQALPDLNAEFEAEYGITLANHIGVNTGEVVAGDASLGQRLVTGDTVNVAARLEQAAGAREILLGDLTYRLVRDAVLVEEVEPLTLKGKSEPVPAYRLLSVTHGTEAVQRRNDTPMIGRESEMQGLGELLQSAIGEGRCRMATVVGDAGVGKTRLVSEFTALASGEAVVIHGRCLSYGDGITFWPLREAVRDACGISPDDGLDEGLEKLRALVTDADVAARLASVIGLSQASFQVPEIFWGARRFLEELARTRPVLLVVDDIHWAEATFLDLIGHLVEQVDSAPVLLLCTSRRELLDRQPDWATDDGNLRLVLSPLTDADAGKVVEGILGGTDIDARVRTRIVQAAAGNPLFVEQLLSMLIDEGVLRRDGDHWVQAGDLSRLNVPPTIEALLAARLDLLEPDERGVIEPASVIGQNFAVAAVTELVGKPLAPEVPRHLDELRTKQLVSINSEADAVDPGYRFQHLLVRDAAYAGLLKRARAELHERFVAWAEAFNAAHGVDNREFEEIHGYHLEQAYRYLNELGTVDEHCLALGIRASQKLADAGRRAMARGDMAAAASLLRRAASTRMPHDRERLHLLPDLGEALMELGEFDEAQRVVREAQESGTEVGDASLVASANIKAIFLKLYLGEHEGWADAVQREIATAMPLFESVGDHVGLAQANRLLFALNAAASQWEKAAAAAEQVAEHARMAGNVRLERRGAITYTQAALLGPTPLPDAIAQVEALARDSTDDRQTLGLLKTWLAQMYAARGDLALGRETYAAASAMLKDLGSGLATISISTELAQIELEGGDLAEAERALRADYAALKAIGESYIISLVIGLLARVVAERGRYEELPPLVDELEAVAGPDDVAAQVDWRSLRAVALAHAGEAQSALELAQEAVRMAADTDWVVLQAETHVRLADVADQAGEAAIRSQALASARALYAQKGAIAALARLHSLVTT